jgi:hypothetical protein
MLTTDGIEDALDDIGVAIIARSRRSATKQRRSSWVRRPRGVVLIGVAVASLGAGAAAATQLFTATHTGIYPKAKWEIKAGGPGEALNIAGTRFRQVALQESADIPYPPGSDAWREWVATSTAAQTGNAPCPPGVKGPCMTAVSTGALRGWFARSAFCAWVVDWRRATLAGDHATATRDARVIAGALRWKAITAEDPHPTTAERYDGGPAPSLFGWILPYLPAVKAGDPTTVDRLIANDTYGQFFWESDPGFIQWVHRTGAHSRDGDAGGAQYMQYLTGGGA